MHDINAILRCNRLQKLYLNHNPVGPLGAQTLAKGLAHNISLREINVAYCVMQYGLEHIIQSVMQHPTLQVLDCSNNYSGTGAVMRALRALVSKESSLKSIRFIDQSVSS